MITNLFRFDPRQLVIGLKWQELIVVVHDMRRVAAAQTRVEAGQFNALSLGRTRDERVRLGEIDVQDGRQNESVR